MDGAVHLNSHAVLSSVFPSNPSTPTSGSSLVDRLDMQAPR